MADNTKPDFFKEEVRTAVRKAWRSGKRVITLSGRKFNLEQGHGDAGKAFILILPVDGMTPVAQLEKDRFGSSKLKDDKGKKLIQPIKKTIAGSRRRR